MLLKEYFLIQYTSIFNEFLLECNDFNFYDIEFYKFKF